MEVTKLVWGASSRKDKVTIRESRLIKMAAKEEAERVKQCLGISTGSMVHGAATYGASAASKLTPPPGMFPWQKPDLFMDSPNGGIVSLLHIEW